MAFITGIPIRNSIHTEESTDIGVWKKYRAELTGLYATGDGTGAMYEQYASQDFREYNKKINDLGLSGRLLLEPMDDGFRFTNDPVCGAYDSGLAGAYSVRGVGFGGPIVRVRRQEMPWISSIDLFQNFVFEADVRLNKDGEIGFDSPVENYSQLGDWMCDFTGLGDIAVEYRESTVKTNKLGDKSSLTVPNDGNFVDQAYQFKTVDCTFEELSTFLPDVVRQNPWSGVNRHSQYFASCRDGTLFEDLPTGYGVMTPYWPPITPADITQAAGSNTGAPLFKGNRVLYGGDISGMALGVGFVEGSGLQAFGLPLSFQWASNGDNRTNNPLQVANYVSKKGGMFTPTDRITTTSGYFTVAVNQKMRWVLDARFKPDGTLGDFIGGSSAYITTWYDQSSTGSARNNFIQPTAAYQPQLINSGAFFTGGNGKVGVKWDVGKNMYIDSQFPNGKIDAFFVSDFDVSDATGRFRERQILLTSSGTSNYIIMESGSTSTSIGALGNANKTLRVNGVDHDPNDPELTRSGVFQLLDGNKLYSVVGGNSSPYTGTHDNILNLGFYNSDPNSTFNFEGLMQETIIYTGDQLSTRTGIEANMNGYFNMF